MKSIAVIGAGNMATAIVCGAIASGVCSAGDISVFDIAEEKAKAFEKYGCVKADDVKSCIIGGDVVLFAVKPQNFGELLPQIKDVCSADKLFVSIAAGISTGYISDELGFDAKIVRVLPNTPMLYGEGASTICSTSTVSDEEILFVKNIFDKCGHTEMIDEKLMNASIAIHSSSPAFIFLFAKCVAETASKYGIEYDTAVKLFAKTLTGSAKMIECSGMTCDELIKMVASPGGTTLAALSSFEADGFEKMISNAMEACTKRAFEIGK